MSRALLGFLIFLGLGFSLPLAAAGQAHATGARADMAAASFQVPTEEREPTDGGEPSREKPGVVPAVREEILVEDDLPAANERALETSSSVTILEIDPQVGPLETLEETLGRAAGLHVVRYGGLGSFSTLSIRGSSAAQVTFYLDGVPLTGAGSSTVNLSEMLVGGLERIEIYRGSAPGRFSAAGIGGVVNLVTRRGKDLGWLLAGSYGDFGTVGARLSRGFRWGPLGGYLGLNGLRSDGDFSFPDDNGTPFNPGDDRTVRRVNNQFSEMGGNLRLAWKDASKVSWDLTATLSGNGKGVPGIGADQSEETRFSQRRALLDIGVGVRDFLTPGGRIRGEIFGGWKLWHYRDLLGEVGVGRQDQKDRFLDLGARIHTEIVLGNGCHRLSALLEARREGYRLSDLLQEMKETTEPSSQRWSGSLVLEDPILLGLGRWEVTPRLRLQFFRNVFRSPGEAAEPPMEGNDRDFLSLEPGLGLRYRPVGNSFVLRLNAGRAARVPGFDELFGERGNTAGNPELRPERGWNFDLGLVVRRPWLPRAFRRAEVTLFASFVDDLIIYIQNSQETFLPFNVGSARVLGIEASLAGRLGPAALEAAYTFQDARDTSGVPFLRGNELPGRPRHQLDAKIALPLGPVGFESSLELLSGNYLDRANLRPVRLRLFQSLGVYAGGRKGWPKLTVEVKNLWNQQRSDLGGFPLPGRSLFAGLRLQLSPVSGMEP